MSKLSSYINEFISLFVMLLLLAALISGQLNGQTMKIAAVDDGRTDVGHIRLEDE